MYSCGLLSAQCDCLRSILHPYQGGQTLFYSSTAVACYEMALDMVKLLDA